MAQSWNDTWSVGTWSQWRWWSNDEESKWQDAKDDQSSSAWSWDDAASSSAVTDTSVKKKLGCLWCKEEHACQYLYLLYTGDWQGGMSCLCYDCWMSSDQHGKGTQTTKEEFKKLASALWTERKKKAGKHASITRGIDYKRAVSEIGQRHQGQDKKAWRADVLHAIKTVGQFVSRAYTKMSDYDKRRFVVAFQ